MTTTSTKKFTADQFTATQWATARDKAQWANDMASWVSRGFPKDGWRKGLYTRLYVNLYGHIAHYDMAGFYYEWFADIHKQLEWLEYAARGGAYGYGGDPAWTWCDVERVFTWWLKGSGLLERYQQLCADDIKQRELAQLAALKKKYEGED